MGKRGPAPKPSALKLVEGTYRKDRAVPDEVQYAEGIPACPKELGPEAKAEWKRIVGELSKVPGLIQKVDRAALAGYCSSYALFLHLEQMIREPDGLVIEYETKSGAVITQPSAWVSIRNQERAAMSHFAQQFGFTPSSRTRVSGPPRKPDGGGKLSKYTG